MAMYTTQDRETLTVTNAVKTLTSSKYRSTTKRIVAALVHPTTYQVTYTTDGTDPVAGTTGRIMNPGDIIPIVGEDMVNFKAIRTTSSDANLEVTYIGMPTV